MGAHDPPGYDESPTNWFAKAWHLVCAVFAFEAADDADFVAFDDTTLVGRPAAPPPHVAWPLRLTIGAVVGVLGAVAVVLGLTLLFGSSEDMDSLWTAPVELVGFGAAVGIGFAFAPTRIVANLVAPLTTVSLFVALGLMAPNNDVWFFVAIGVAIVAVLGVTAVVRTWRDGRGDALRRLYRRPELELIGITAFVGITLVQSNRDKDATWWTTLPFLLGWAGITAEILYSSAARRAWNADDAARADRFTVRGITCLVASGAAAQVMFSLKPGALAYSLLIAIVIVAALVARFLTIGFGGDDGGGGGWGGDPVSPGPDGGGEARIPEFATPRADASA